MKEQQLLESPILPPQLLLDTLPIDLRPEYRRRLEIILRTKMGQSKTEICEAVGCAPETARHWMAMARAEQIQAWNTAPGRPRTVNEKYLERLRDLVSYSPKDYGYSFERWTAKWLQSHLAQEFGIEVSPRHINRLLKKMGLSTRTTPPGSKKPEPVNAGIKIGDLPGNRPKKNLIGLLLGNNSPNILFS